MHRPKLLVVCTIVALLCSAIAQPTNTEQQNGDNGSILDSIASVTDDMQGEASATTANVTEAVNGLLPGAGAGASNMTADVSQFAGMWASAKCPVDVKSVIADSDVQKMTASCDPSKAADSSYCAACTCAYIEVISNASMRAGSAAAGQSGADSTTSDLTESLAYLKCLGDADAVIRTAIGHAASAKWGEACSQLTETPQFVMQMYQQCLTAILAVNSDDDTEQDGSSSPGNDTLSDSDASPAVTASDGSPLPATDSTASTTAGQQATRAANVSTTGGSSSTGSTTGGSARSWGTTASITKRYMLLVLAAVAALV